MADYPGYFDYAAATPMDIAVRQAMEPYFGEKFYNPSADYEPAREVRAAVEAARGDVAQILGAKPAEIVFTAGGTEANNLAVAGIMSRFPEGNMILSAIEHDSVRAVAERFNARECPVTKDGLVDVSKLVSLIDDNTVLISVITASNEIGTIQPIREIAGRVQNLRLERKKNGNKLPLLLHSDAAQAANYIDLHVHRLGVDLLSLNGGKIYGPKQSGALYVRGGVGLDPQIVGGGQERNLRSGTENVPAIIGFAAALKKTIEIRNDEAERMRDLQKYFLSRLAERIPAARLNGSLKHRLPNNINITIPGQDNERLLILLDEKHIYAAAGSACSASSDEPSHVLAALGLNDDDIRASLRFSMGRFTVQEDIDRAVAELAAVLA